MMDTSQKYTWEDFIICLIDMQCILPWFNMLCDSSKYWCLNNLNLHAYIVIQNEKAAVQLVSFSHMFAQLCLLFMQANYFNLFPVYSLFVENCFTTFGHL